MAEFRVVFVAADYDATVGFFTDVMGLKLQRSFGDDQLGCIIEAADGLIEIFGAAHDRPSDPVSGVVLAWEVADADAEHERLVAAGAEIVQVPELQPWGHKNFVVQGPDGWKITLFQIVVPQ